MTCLPYIRDTTPGIYQVCTTANTDYAIQVPNGAKGAVLWFETAAADPTVIGGRIGVDQASTRLGTENVTGGGGPLPGTAVTVTFEGALAGQDVPLMTATSSLTGGTTPAVTVAETTKGAAGVNEVQTITITGAPTGGSFTLTFNGQTTAAIAYNATAADVESALENLTSITGITGTDNVLGYHPPRFLEYELNPDYNRAGNAFTQESMYLHVANSTAGAVVRGMWVYDTDTGV